MIKKLIYHLIVVFIIFSTLWFVIEKFSKFNPVFTAIQDIKFSDIYFSYFNSINPSSEIYIVDIGMKSHKQTRFEIAEFIEKVNKKHKPSVIGVDVYFEYNKEKINQKLISSLAMDNVVRMFKLSEDNFLVNGRNKSILYPDFSFLPGLDTNLFNKDGFTFGLGVATDHPCIRFYKPNLNLNGKTYNHFSKLVAQKHLNKTDQYINSEINFDKKIMINYNVDFSKNRISINDSSRYHELKDKIVLIGLNTYKNDGSPLYNYDIHFTPKNKNYIGRSAKDSYGIAIISTTISNITYNDHLQYNKFLHGK